MNHSVPGSSPPQPAVEGDREGDLSVTLEAPGTDLEQYNNSRSPHPAWSSGRWAGPYSTYGLPWRALVARRRGVVVGLLPLVHQRSLLFGRRTVSLPWVDAAGLTTDSPAIAQALVQAALGEMRQAGTTRLDLRQESPLFDWPVERDDKLAMQLELAADPEALWKRFDPKVRNQVRKSEKSGIVVETNPVGGLAQFHAVYSQNMRDLGSPPPIRSRFLNACSSHLGKRPKCTSPGLRSRRWESPSPCATAIAWTSLGPPACTNTIVCV